MKRLQALLAGFFPAIATVVLFASLSAHAQEHVLTSFGTFTGDSENAIGDVAFDSSGNIYGATFLGGAFDDGSVFELSPPSVLGGHWTEQVLYSFTGGADGSLPNAGVALDSSGALYGTTELGGTCGVVYKLSPPTVSGDPWTESVIHDFTCGDDGGGPLSSLIFDKNGNLYGTTQLGGANGGGTVFELSPPAVSGDPWPETVLYAFTSSQFSFLSTHGCFPYSGVIMGPAGALYGTTEFCGAGDNGVVYKLAPPSATHTNWVHSVLHTFTPTTGDGARPRANLAMSRTGQLYGTTTFGGPDGEGTVFSLDPTAGWAETTLFQFTGGADGGIPIGHVTIVPPGNIYGTTYNGGVHWGVIYKLTLTSGGWVETVPYTFTGGNDGGGLMGGLLLHNGILYGTAEFGGTVGFGTSGKGVVYSFIP